MTYRCPRCQSESVETNDIARKVGCTIGAIAGAAGVVTRGVNGTEVGVVARLMIGAAEGALGSFAGSVVGALVGGAAGGRAGARLGEVIDENILKNFLCLACKDSFSATEIDPIDTPFSEQ